MGERGSSPKKANSPKDVDPINIEGYDFGPYKKEQDYGVSGGHKEELEFVWNVEELEKTIHDIQVPCGSIVLNSYSTITDVKKFIQTHVSMLKANNAYSCDFGHSFPFKAQSGRFIPITADYWS